MARAEAADAAEAAAIMNSVATYRTICGRIDHFAQIETQSDRLLDVQDDQIVLDPFCGTGTTLVESMKRGIVSVGIDASPFSCFVSRVKTNRALSADVLLRALVDIGIEY